MKKLLTLVLCIALAISTMPFLAPLQAAAPDAPTGLLTEYVSNPMGIDTLIPGFSWIVNDSDRGETQTAYQIIVASSLSNINSDTGDKWDSGKVTSSRSTNVKYNGGALSSNTRYWWKVKTWDKDNNTGAYSIAATFDEALRSGDWTASFIWDGTTNTNNYCYLRKKINISKTVSLVKFYVSAHDDYKLYINGNFIDKGPAPNDPYDMMQYNSYDVTTALQSGDNVIAVIAHWHGANAIGRVTGVPAFIFQGNIKFTDATSITVNSDSTWKVKSSTPWNESSAIRGPSWANATAVEDYDARKEISGWMGISFNDTSWANASVISPGYTLKAQFLENETVEAVVDPVAITQPAAGVWIVDMGKNYTGWPVLTVNNATSGTMIKVYYSEEKSGARIVRDRNGITNYHDIYYCKGGASETWEPDTEYNCARFMEIEGYPGTLTSANIKWKYSHTNINKAGNFNSGNSLINSIYQNCVQTQKNNTHGILVDCPQREHAQYAADAYISSFNDIYNFKNSGVLKKAVLDMGTGQESSKNIRAHHPSSSFQDIPEWSLWWVLASWEQYYNYNDIDTLQSLYQKMKDLMNTYFNTYRNVTTNLLENTPGWEISDYPESTMDTSGASLLPQNCLYYAALKAMAKSATVLGYTTDATNFTSTANNVKTGINNNLFDGVEKYKSCTGSTQYTGVGSAFALYFGVVPEDKKSAVLSFMKSKGFDAGVYGGFMLTNTLYNYDEGDKVFDLVNQTNNQNGNWGYQVSIGETTTWESWAGQYSHCHAWAAYPMYFLLRGLAGIEATDVAFSKFKIRPRLPANGDLSFAEGTVPSIKGNITTRWDRVSGGITLTASIPANTLSEVHIPIAGYSNCTIQEGATTIWNNGTYLGGVAGISYLGNDSKYVIFNVGSGSYSFTMNGTYVGPTPTPTPTPDPNAITYLADNFDDNSIDTAKWEVIDKGLESTAASGIAMTETGAQLRTSGTTSVNYWAGKTLKSKGYFNPTAAHPLTVDVDRVSLAGSGTAYRSSIWLWKSDTEYVHVSQDINETNWSYNKDGGTGGGTQIWNDANLGNKHVKLVHDGDSVHITVDGVERTVVSVSWNSGVRVMLTGQARMSGDSVTAVFDNLTAAISGVATSTPTSISTPTPTPTSAPTSTPASITYLADNFDDNSIDTAKWEVIDKGLESTAVSGIAMTETGAQLRASGTTSVNYWGGKTLKSKDYFNPTAANPLTVDVDRVSLAGSGTAYRSSVWLWKSDTEYVHLNQDIGEYNWCYNKDGGTGGGTQIWNDANLGNKHVKLVHDGDSVHMTVDGVERAVVSVAWNSGVRVMLTGQARASGDTVTAIFDNLTAALSGAATSTPTPTSTATPTPTPTATPGGPLYSEDFNDGAAQNWTVSSGTWAVESQEYSGTSIPGDGLAYYSATNFSNFTLTLNSRYIGSSTSDQNIIFRYTDANNFYQAFISKGSGAQYLRIYKRVGGTYTQIGNEAAYNPPVDTNLNWTITCNGSSISVTVNDGTNNKNVTATDTAFTTGKIGLKVFNAHAHFDNILVN